MLLLWLLLQLCTLYLHWSRRQIRNIRMYYFCFPCNKMVSENETKCNDLGIWGLVSWIGIVQLPPYTCSWNQEGYDKVLEFLKFNLNTHFKCEGIANPGWPLVGMKSQIGWVREMFLPYLLDFLYKRSCWLYFFTGIFCIENKVLYLEIYQKVAHILNLKGSMPSVLGDVLLCF